MRVSLIIITLFLGIITGYSQDDEIDPRIFKQDTITWFGADFSMFKLYNKKKDGQEVDLEEYIFAWNQNYKQNISNVKLANWLSVKKVINDKEYTDEVSNNFPVKDWITSDKHSFSERDIENHLDVYTTKQKGVGLVYIIECFNKEIPSVEGYFVWFDLNSRKPIHIFRVNGSPRTAHFNIVYGVELWRGKEMPKNKGMTGYWLQGMIDATLVFGIEFKEKKALLEK